MEYDLLCCILLFSSVIEGLGLLLTAWRIYVRLKIGRFWWEDAWAAILLPMGLSWIAAHWIYVFETGSAATIATWIFVIGFTCLVTFARMSILFSIIRIVHDRNLLKFAYACATIFVVSWVVLAAQKAVECARGSSQHSRVITKSVCSMTVQMTIFKVTTDCISVFILVVLPLRMLWRVRLPRRKRRMILSIFASSVVLAFAALFHTVGGLLNVFVETIAGVHVEVALSIIVCNLLVVVTYTSRTLVRERAGSGQTTTSTEDDDDFTTWQRPATTSPAAGLSLTTVDIDVSFSLGSQELSSQGSSSQVKENV